MNREGIRYKPHLFRISFLTNRSVVLIDHGFFKYCFDLMFHFVFDYNRNWRGVTFDKGSICDILKLRGTALGKRCKFVYF